MFISFREAQLHKRAESPNKFPWNVTDHSKDEDTGNPDSTDPPRKIINLKVDPARVNLLDHRRFLNWEMLNQVGDDIRLHDDAHPKGTKETK